MLFIYFILLILSLNVIELHGDDDILSKFHQTQYKLNNWRIEVEEFNKDVYSLFDARTFKFNRTTVAANLTFVQKVTFNGKSLEVLAQTYKFASNEYRHFPARAQVNLYKIFMADVLGCKTFCKCGNFPVDDFIFKKGVRYQVCNIVPDDTHLPPLIPPGSYKIHITLFDGKKELGRGAGYGEIAIPFKI